MRDYHGQGIPGHEQLGQVVSDGAAKLGDDPIAFEPDGDAHHEYQGEEEGHEPAAVQWLALVGPGREDKPGERTRPQGQHRSTRQGGNRGGGDDGGGDLPQPLSVPRRACEGKGQGGEARQFEKLGRVIGIDEGTDHEPGTRAEVAIDHGFVGRAMTEPHGHRCQARARDQTRCDEAQATPAGQHQCGQGHAQCSRGLGELAVGFGWVEAERLGAVKIRKGKQRGAFGIEQSAQPGRQGHDLRGGDQEKEEGKREGESGAEGALAALG